MNIDPHISRIGLIRYFLKGSVRFFICSLCFAALTSLFDLAGPRIIGLAADAVMPYFTAAAAVAVIALADAVCRYLFHLTNAMGEERFVKRIRDLLFSHIERLPYRWYTKHPTGDVIQRCTSDVDTLRRFLSEQLTSMLRIIILLLFSLTFMWRISPALTAAAAVFVPLIVLYSVFFYGRIEAAFLAADREEGKLSACAQENLTGVRVVRAFGREAEEKRKFERQNQIYTRTYLKLAKLLTAFWIAGDFISGIQVMAIVALGAVFTVRGAFSSGDYISFIAYNALLVWPVRNLGRVLSDMSKAGVSIDRIREIMCAGEEADPPNALTPSMRQDILFDHVSFRYGADMPKILDDISFTIRKGTTVGILGGTGSGKSTLALLLDRLYELPENSGHIFLRDDAGRCTDIADISVTHLRKNIGMVLQEPFLFSRTLEENIRIAGRDASADDVRTAAEIASLDKTVRSFSGGYDTFVGERGVTLSGGQKQRAAIAQMLVRKTPVMIFDDSLSAVDAETDARIRRALFSEVRGSTVILISHRISTLMHADQILVLNRGRITESGTHRELYLQNGIYRKICDIQSVGV